MRFSAFFQFPLLQRVVLPSLSVFPVLSLEVSIVDGTSEIVFCVRARLSLSPDLAVGYLTTKCVDAP